MKKLITALLLVFPFTALSSAVLASGAEEYPLEEFKADLNNKMSLQNGAKIYLNYCMGCHSLKYSRYERVADDLHIPHDLAEKNLIFDGSKIGSLMENSLPTPLAKKWFGAEPPDLTLVARARSPQWVYTYLKTFYADPSRPWGVNNKVFPSVGMPHVLLELQGLQECVPAAGHEGHQEECGAFKIIQKGKLSPDEYEKAIYDLVNFLEYVAEPMALERERLGVYVIIYLLILLIPAYFLNKEYWKDVH